MAVAAGTVIGAGAAIGGILQGIGALRSKAKTPKTKLPSQHAFVGPSHIFRGGQLFRRPEGAFGTGPGAIPQQQSELLGFTRSLRGPLTNLQAELRPGFGRLSQIASTTIRQRGAQAVGDLRSNLARRGVLGSSFGSDAISRVQAEFAQQEQLAQAQAVIQEIAAQTGLSQVLIQQAQAESAQLAQQIQTELAEFGIAADLMSQVVIGEFNSIIGTAQINALREELGLPPVAARSKLDPKGRSGKPGEGGRTTASTSSFGGGIAGGGTGSAPNPDENVG